MRQTMARVEFLACKGEINELLRQGYSATEIYAKLVNAQRLSLSKDYFRRLIKRYCDEPEPLKQIPLPKDRLKKPSIIRKDGQKSRTSQYGGRHGNNNNTTFRREERTLEDMT